MDAGDAHQMGAAGGVEVIQIRDVLEVVGVLIAVLHSGIGHHIVAVLVDLQVDALLGQNGYALLQDLGVGGGRGSYVQSDGLLRLRRLLGLRVIGGVGLGRVIGLAAAGGEGQGQRQGQQSGKNLVFHVLFLQ